MPKQRPYDFTHSISNPENWARQYIDFASEQTDAPWDFHELYALSLLGIASHGLEIIARPHPEGLQLNLFALIKGVSAIGRKSTCMEIAESVLEIAIGTGYGRVDEFSPEGLMESMARNDGRPVVLYMDEFSSLIEKMARQHMMGTKSILLKLYRKKKHRYDRTSKGTGKKKVEDVTEINEAHLNLVGNITPTIQEKLTISDIEDGFLGRFIIVDPDRKPEPMKFRQDDNITWRFELGEKLSSIAQACQRCKEWARENHKRTIMFDEDALDLHWEYQQRLESAVEQEKLSFPQFVIIQRLIDILLKTSALIALGETDPLTLAHGPLYVTKDHMLQGLDLVRKWQKWAINFVNNVGHDKHEAKINKILYDLEHAKDCTLDRSIIMQKNKLKKDEVDKMEATLIAREVIIAKVALGQANRKKIQWQLLNGQPKSPPPTVQGLEDATPKEQVSEGEK
jgi:hypothetical protein